MTSADCPPGEYCVGACILSGEPTLLTEIIEPPDGQGNPAAITKLDYHDTSDKAGLLESVTDPNGVVTLFGYDQWGQRNSYKEGRHYDFGSDPITHIDCGSSSNSAGHVEASWCSPCGLSDYDAMCNETGSSCCLNACVGQCGGCLCSSSTSQTVPSPFPKLPSGAAAFPSIYGGFSGAQYSPKHQLTNMPATVTYGSGSPVTRARTHAIDYDELGRATDFTITSDESGSPVHRAFTDDFSTWNVGTVTRSGPDGVETVVEFDAAYRVTKVTRENSPTTFLQAEYSYYDNGLVHTITNGNGTDTAYVYDDAQRVTVIEHRTTVTPPASPRILMLEYAYTANNLVASITERDDDLFSVAATVTFTYDNRGRLIREDRNDFRQLFDSYDIAYEYDQGGNRTKKIEQTNFVGTTIETSYTYDVDNVPLYGSSDNRLMQWIKKRVTQGGGTQSATSGGGDPTTSALAPGAPGGGAAPAAPGGGGPTVTTIEEAWYFYNDQGNATRVVRRIPGTFPNLDAYSATRMGYALNGRALSFVMAETWEYAGNDKNTEPINYVGLNQRRFRYDGARQRYLKERIGPPIWDEVVSDYDGDTIYGDFTVSGSTTTEQRSFEPGIGKFDWSGGSPDTSSAEYYHSDMIGTTRLMTDSTGSAIEPAKYTAFGELVSGTARRYGYAGSWGYQTDDLGQLPFLHLGHRYYDPESGRFLQRDPKGIRGGLNVYAYVFNMPTVGVDPLGRGFWSAIGGAISGALSGAASGFVSGAITGFIIGGPAGAAAGATAGAAGGAISGAISGAVAGGTGASTFGGGFASGAPAGAFGGIGGGALGGALGAGAGMGGAVIAGSLGGAAGGAGAAGAGGGSIGPGAAAGAVFGAAGGAAGAGGKTIMGCVLESDAALWGGILGR